jgi:hypothetical protein
MIFQKAVDEPFFCVVYSKLCKALHDMALERKATLTKPGSEEIIPLATHFKSLLLNNCQQQFEKAEKDALREREREVEARRVASDPVELEKISKMPRTEREKCVLPHGCGGSVIRSSPSRLLRASFAVCLPLPRPHPCS